MANIGSSFLGDHPRTRIRLGSGSTPGSTPPSSPPPPPGAASSTSTAHQPQSFPAELYSPPRLAHKPLDMESAQTQPQTQAQSLPPQPVPPPQPLDPAQSLELRLRWLEAILYGSKPRAHQQGQQTATLVRNAEVLKRRMDEVVSAHDSLRRFVDHYQRHGHLLTPAFALSGTLPAPPTYEGMAPAELDAFLAELEPDVRAADRDMREIEALEAKGVLSAGKLPDYEELQPRLDALISRHEEDARKAGEIEGRVAGLIQRYGSQVDQLSEVFVEWDDLLREAEDRIVKLERDKAERVRLGYE